MEPEAPKMLSLQMQNGNLNGLKDPSSILLSRSSAKTIFGDTDPIIAKRPISYFQWDL
jgi:putative ABC transport system permease protein